MDNSYRGTKRKRYEPPTEDLHVKIAGKLHHNLKEIRKTAKKAKTFETQKLLKKLRGIRNNNGRTQELDAQLEALKPISHELIANTVLKTRLNKDRILSQNEHVRSAATKELGSTLIPAASGTPAAKCESRLLSSKILAAEVAVVVEDLRNFLQPKSKEDDSWITDEDTSTISRKNKQVLQEGASQGVELRSTRSEGRLERTEDALPLEELDSESDIEEAGGAGWESSTVDDNEKNTDGVWESGFLEDSDLDNNAKELAAPVKNKPSDKSARSKAPPSTVMSSVQQSTFLPSLSAGFVRGASDDSDFDGMAAATGDIDFKKNRRGQRARRAIWEKKYGRNANHKKKELEHRGASSSGKERQHGGAASGQHRDAPTRRQAGGNAVTHAQHNVNQHANAAVQPARIPAQGREERSLHPSWEAKRKLKEKESASIVPSRGQKIKFS